ncbi:MAG: PilZ domain-containing protein [Planctomycetota bacterium]|jgi:hypothetical protein|nr:PilZ domain-containing protein [Planctomycetota bacterium]
MPVCAICNASFEKVEDLQLVRNQDNRWISVCKACRDKKAAPDKKTQPPPVASEVVSALAAEAGTPVPKDDSLSPMENARLLLSNLKSFRNTAASKTIRNTRSFERHSIEIKVAFALSRDSTSYDGVIKDISRGGILLESQKQLVKGQLLIFDWKNPLPPVIAAVLQNNAEVRRVNPAPGGGFLAGLRFVRRHVVNSANRRRFKRYRCDLPAFYQRQGSEILSRGIATNISQGGCQLLLDEEFNPSETFYIRLIGGAEGHGDLAGNVQIRRVIPRDHQFETGCAFVKIGIERTNLATTTAAAASPPEAADPARKI